MWCNVCDMDIIYLLNVYYYEYVTDIEQWWCNISIMNVLFIYDVIMSHTEVNAKWMNIK